jgi:hypothetical protein
MWKRDHEYIRFTEWNIKEMIVKSRISSNRQNDMTYRQNGPEVPRIGITSLRE